MEHAPEVGASRIPRDKVAEKENVRLFVNRAVNAFEGDRRLEAVVVENRATEEEERWDYDGVFVFIGMTPSSDLVKDVVDVDAQGFVTTGETLMTSMPGLFAAGDVRKGSTQQAASAAGEGAAAALLVRDYLRKL